MPDNRKIKYWQSFFAALLILFAADHACAALPAGCGAGADVRQDGVGGSTTTIQLALNLIAKTLGTTTCVVIRDTQTYSEQVTIQGFTFTNATDTLKIMSDPSFVSSAPAVNPPAASIAAFRILNASVTLQNISIISTNSVSYGVIASSNYVTLSSVTVLDTTGKITTGGVVITGSFAAMSYSKVVVGAPSGLRLDGLRGNVSYSTFSATTGFPDGAVSIDGSFNVITRSYIEDRKAGNGYGLVIFGTASSNLISFSHMASNSVNGIAAYFNSGFGFNTVSQSFITNSAGGNGIQNDAQLGNVVSRSTITTQGTAIGFINSGTQLIDNCYVQGGDAIDGDADDIVVSGSVLIATNTTGFALQFQAPRSNLTVTSTTLRGGPQGAALLMQSGTGGSVVLTSNTITGGRWGLSIATMTCGACGGNINITSMTFPGGLTAGATAIHFTGGRFISTFTGVGFNDPNIAVNVNGRALSAASRITMQLYSGARAGSLFENDVLNLIDWGGVNPAPTNPLATGVFLSSVAVNFGTVGAAQYVVEASTAANFTGTLFASIGAAGPLVLSPLARNTTYYLRAGALWGAATFYANTTPIFEVTLASTPAPLSFTGITPNQFNVNWRANSNPVATDYEVTISTKVDFSLIASSLTTTAVTNLFTSLLPQTTYFARVRAVNGAGVGSAYALGAVVTTNGVITISANRLSSVWYGATDTVFNAQGAANFHYAVNTDPAYVPTNADSSFDGSALPVILPQGIVYFHVTGDNGGASVGVGHFGPMFIDLAAPIVPTIAAQVSAANVTPVPDGSVLFSPTPHITWTAPTNTASPIVGYSVSLSSEPADQPALLATTILTFTDFILTQPYVWYVKVRAQNQAGTWGSATGMSFTYSIVPTASDIILRKNYFNPLRGECTSISVQVTAAGHLKVKLYTLMGQLVSSWIDQDVAPGSFSSSWCGRNSAGQSVASGAYILHVEAPDQKKNFKVIVVQ